MLACVCQPAETKLYKGGRATPIGPLGGPRRPLQRPRSLKSRPPKPPPKPYSYSTTSEDTKSSSSQQKSPKNLLSLKKIEQRAKSTKIPSVCSSVASKEDDPFKPGNQEKLLKIHVSDSDMVKDQVCNNVVTITDNDGRIYCVDNLILVGEDLLSKIKGGFGDSGDENQDAKKCPSYPKDTLTVKQKTDENDGDVAKSDGTNACQVLYNNISHMHMILYYICISLFMSLACLFVRHGVPLNYAFRKHGIQFYRMHNTLCAGLSVPKWIKA